jgi:hypothetical protein
MLEESDKNNLNYTLAIGYIITSIQLKGEAEAMKEIDNVFDNAMHRLYIRKLFTEAKEIMSDESIE